MPTNIQCNTSNAHCLVKIDDLLPTEMQINHFAPTSMHMNLWYHSQYQGYYLDEATAHLSGVHHGMAGVSVGR